MRIRAARALLPGGFRDDVVVTTVDGQITEVAQGSASDGPARVGTLFPGLVNAHVHLEIGPPEVPGGAGLPAWVTALRRRGDVAGDGFAAARHCRDAGTAVVLDVSNGGHTAPALAAAGLVGVVQHELLGMGPATLGARLLAAAAPDRVDGRVVTRPGPHSTYSTHPELIVAACRPGAAPASIHLAEDPAERDFTARGEGPFAELLDNFGVPWRHLPTPGCSPVGFLDRLGVLSPRLLCVHGVDLDDDDRRRIVARGSAVVTCPRSNLHVGGRLPDVPALLRAGVRLAVGTDSLGSVPDLDLVAEVELLARSFPEVPEDVFWSAATAGGADALCAAGYGRIRVGASPGLWWLDPDGGRRWLS